jgi:FkbM family methyltransferase
MNKLFELYRYAFASPRFQGFHKKLLKISLSGLGIGNYENTNLSGEKYLVDVIIPKMVRGRQPVFFDVGANVGDYTRSLSEKFPHAKIYAFEPHPTNFAQLSKIQSPNISLFNLAVGDEAKSLTLYDRADYDGSPHASLHKEVISNIHKHEVIEFEVEVECLDTLAEQQSIQRIDWLKIDTEGHELAVLQGASKLLQSSVIRCIHFEFNEMNIVSRVFFRDFRKLLSGYSFYRLLPNGLIMLDENPMLTEVFAYQNILAISNQELCNL